MEDRSEEKNRCKACKAVIDKKYDYCRVCNEKLNIEIAITNKFPNDLPRTIIFFKIQLLNMFMHPKKNRIILSFTKNNANIADIVIKETNLFYLQEKRYLKTEETKTNPTTKIELIKAPLKLISSVVALKNDREERKLRWYD
mgnify:CR=1 FL=1